MSSCSLIDVYNNNKTKQQQKWNNKSERYTTEMTATSPTAQRTRSLKLTEQHTSTVPENGVLNKIFEPNREEEANDWRKSYAYELHSLYSSSHINRASTKKFQLADSAARQEELQLQITPPLKILIRPI